MTHSLPILQLAIFHPSSKRPKSLTKPREVCWVAPEEELEVANAILLRSKASFSQPLPRQLLLRIVVLTHEAADGHSAVRLEQRYDRIEHLTTHILEVDIDAFRASVFQGFSKRRSFVVHAFIEAEFVDAEVTFLLPSSDADDAATLDLRNLSDYLADGTTGGAHDDRFP
eukprot:TRINITY_DN30144_c0_g1_i1.p1 TRINITY_DN30144_c0_g1~~TRINITY_DN30144_c0_g1_i1.p1  ORF type:complete len:170 (+),score=13.81 TRINITY_DN30144_c0_g1_i1:210-719(+)